MNNLKEKNNTKLIRSFDPFILTQSIIEFIKKYKIHEIEITAWYAHPEETKTDTEKISITKLKNILYWYFTTCVGEGFYFEAHKCLFEYHYCAQIFKIEYPKKMEKEFEDWTEKKLLGE